MLRQSSVLIAGFACAVAAQADFAAWARERDVTAFTSSVEIVEFADGYKKSVRNNFAARSISIDTLPVAAEGGIRTLESGDVSPNLFAQAPDERDSRRRDEFRGGGFQGGPGGDFRGGGFPGGGDFRRDDSRRGGEQRGGDGGSNRTAKTAPPPKVKVILKLPAQYTPYDKNGDQQIGLYEWDRAKLAEFLALDRNGDGFLTARELDDPIRPVASTVSTPGAAGTGGSGTVMAATTTAVTAALSEEADPEVRRAKYFFSLTDKDKNGEISAEEWAASRGVRVMFEKAKSTAAPPFKETAFIEQFKAIKKQ